MNCPNCNATISDDVKECPICGADLTRYYVDEDGVIQCDRTEKLCSDEPINFKRKKHGKAIAAAIASVAIIAGGVVAGVMMKSKQKVNENVYTAVNGDSEGFEQEVKKAHEFATEFNGHYYYVFSKGLSWDEAKKKCESTGGHLVVITSPEEQSFIQDELLKDHDENEYYWLGLYDKNHTAEFSWVGDSTFAYNNWAPDMPIKNTDSEYYVLMYNKNDIVNNVALSKGQWATVPKDGDSIHKMNTIGFICEWEY